MDLSRREPKGGNCSFSWACSRKGSFLRAAHERMGPSLYSAKERMGPLSSKKDELQGF